MSGNSERILGKRPICPNCGILTDEKTRLAMGRDGWPFLWLLVNPLTKRINKHISDDIGENSLEDINYVYCLNCRSYFGKSDTSFDFEVDYVQDNEFVECVKEYQYQIGRRIDVREWDKFLLSDE